MIYIYNDNKKSKIHLISSLLILISAICLMYNYSHIRVFNTNLFFIFSYFGLLISLVVCFGSLRDMYKKIALKINNEGIKTNKYGFIKWNEIYKIEFQNKDLIIILRNNPKIKYLIFNNLILEHEKIKEIELLYPEKFTSR